MSPLLAKGDKITVIKPIFGARVINLYDYFFKDTVSYYRLPGLCLIKPNDIVVFNYPYKNWNYWDKIEIQHNKFYVKRCVGLPGDSIGIQDAVYYSTRIENDLGDKYNQKYMSNHHERVNLLDTVIPYSKHHPRWTVFNMGPIYIPQKGDTISLNYQTAYIYKNIIEWESKNILTISDSAIRLGSHVIDKYVFMNNYYFMAGDNVSESIDSRFWGLIPEILIVGKVVFM